MLTPKAFDLRSPKMLMAFTGWNDAGESASGALNQLLHSWDRYLIAEFDPEEYYDYQVNRPIIRFDEEGERVISWPTTKVYGVKSTDLPHDLIIVLGQEPSHRWQSFAREIINIAEDYEVDTLIAFGGLLADVPHSRPISISATTFNPKIASKYQLELSSYEGITGILSVISERALNQELEALSLWALVPHYVSTAPSPKASLALIEALEDILKFDLPSGNLPKAATAWELSVDQLAKDDHEVGEYVNELEKNKDASEANEATGDSIARELERFLRKRSED
jgi:predicted ATP-grasp superfamily ATP-dependent carboligase